MKIQLLCKSNLTWCYCWNNFPIGVRGARLHSRRTEGESRLQGRIIIAFPCFVLNVKSKGQRRPTDGEKVGGLAAVALTIGEENVKGTDGGVDGAAGS